MTGRLIATTCGVSFVLGYSFQANRSEIRGAPIGRRSVVVVFKLWPRALLTLSHPHHGTTPRLCGRWVLPQPGNLTAPGLPNGFPTAWALARRRLPRVRFHPLRHSPASALIAAGGDIVTVNRCPGRGFRRSHSAFSPSFRPIGRQWSPGFRPRSCAGQGGWAVSWVQKLICTSSVRGFAAASLADGSPSQRPRKFL